MSEKQMLYIVAVILLAATAERADGGSAFGEGRLASWVCCLRMCRLLKSYEACTVMVCGMHLAAQRLSTLLQLS